MSSTDIDNEPASKHQKRIHRHGRFKYLARSVFCCKRIGSKMTTVRLGTLCPHPGCGFNPNETTRKWIRETRLQAGQKRAYSSPAD